MDELSYGPLTLELSKIGYFKRPEANIYWLGIRDNEQLFKIQATLHQALKDRGFKLEDRPYRPHISLGRKVILKNDFNADELNSLAEKISIQINKVDLMKSEFAKGELKYTILYSKGLA